MEATDELDGEHDEMNRLLLVMEGEGVRLRVRRLREGEQEAAPGARALLMLRRKAAGEEDAAVPDCDDVAVPRPVGVGEKQLLLPERCCRVLLVLVLLSVICEHCSVGGAWSLLLPRLVMPAQGTGGKGSGPRCSGCGRKGADLCIRGRRTGSFLYSSCVCICVLITRVRSCMTGDEVDPLPPSPSPSLSSSPPPSFRMKGCCSSSSAVALPASSTTRQRFKKSCATYMSASACVPRQTPPRPIVRAGHGVTASRAPCACMYATSASPRLTRRHQCFCLWSWGMVWLVVVPGRGRAGVVGARWRWPRGRASPAGSCTSGGAEREGGEREGQDEGQGSERGARREAERGGAG